MSGGNEYVRFAGPRIKELRAQALFQQYNGHVPKDAKLNNGTFQSIVQQVSKEYAATHQLKPKRQPSYHRPSTLTTAEKNVAARIENSFRKEKAQYADALAKQGVPGAQGLVDKRYTKTLNPKPRAPRAKKNVPAPSFSLNILPPPPSRPLPPIPTIPLNLKF